MHQFIVKLNVRQRAGYLSAVSQEVPGLHIAGSTHQEVRERALKAIPMLLKANRHLDVQAAPTDDLTEIRITVQ